jgi:hypothetical protein
MIDQIAEDEMTIVRVLTVDKMTVGKMMMEKRPHSELTKGPIVYWVS